MLKNDKRYKYLINARNNHFTLSNTWMVFFVTINGALFVAYYTMLGKGSNLEKFIILSFGYIAALLFHCAAKSYHYWNDNFILINSYFCNSLPNINVFKHENRDVKKAYDDLVQYFGKGQAIDIHVLTEHIKSVEQSIKIFSATSGEI